MTIIFNNFFIFPFQFVDNRTLRLLNKTVAGKKLCIVSHIKRGQIVDRCTKSGLKGIPNLHNGGQIDEPTNYRQYIDDSSLFIPRECCRFTAYGGRIDKVKVYLICMKRVQKVSERVQNIFQKLR